MNKFIPCQGGAVYTIPHSCGADTLAKMVDVSMSGYGNITLHKKPLHQDIGQFLCSWRSLRNRKSMEREKRYILNLRQNSRRAVEVRPWVLEAKKAGVKSGDVKTIVCSIA